MRLTTNSRSEYRPQGSKMIGYVRARTWGHIRLPVRQVNTRVKVGDRVFGYVGVTCALCKTRRIYWVYAKLGTDGWYTEALESPSFAKIEQRLDSIRDQLDAFLNTFKGEKIPIADYP